VRRSGLVDSLLRELGSALAGEQIGVSHDPPIAEVDALATAMRESASQAVLAIGGGSVMDAAKAAAGIAPSGLPCAEFYHNGRAIAADAIPIVALPTTAGTGAEITKNSVLSDPFADTKKSIRSLHIIPKVAIIDPELTVSASPEITAASGMDALTQAVESYLSLGAHATSQALAIASVRLLMRWLPAAFANGQDREARTRVAEGSMLSAMAFGQSGLGAVHGLAHPIGHVLDLAHGFTCAVLLPHILRWNASARPVEMDEMAAACGLADGPAFIDAIEAMARSFGIPRGFAELRTTDRSDYIVANCRSGSMKANPRPMEDADVIALLHTLANEA
jgi:alcohol dehydrogenase class IV